MSLGINTSEPFLLQINNGGTLNPVDTKGAEVEDWSAAMPHAPHCECFVIGVIAYYTYIWCAIYMVVLGVGRHGGGLAYEGRLPSSLWVVL